MVTLTLYKNNSPNNYIDKVLTSPYQINGQFVDPFSYASPNVAVSSGEYTGLTQVNYFEILGHYYYLIDYTVDTSGIATITGELDVLMTYKAYVKSLVVRAERSSSHGSSNITDDMALVSASTVKNTINFPNPIPDDSRSGCFILTTAQAGY